MKGNFKFSIALSFCILIAFSAFAQSPETAVATTDTVLKTQTLFGKFKPKVSKIGFYIAPEFQYLGAAGTYATGGGGSAMLIFNERFSIGAARYGARSFTPTLSDNTGLTMNFGYGGLAMEFATKPQKLVHFTFPVLIGAGYARLDSAGTRYNFGRDRDNFGWNNSYNRTNNNNMFFVAQVGVRAEMNVARFAKVFVGGSYRLAAGSSVTYPVGTTTNTLSNSQLSGLTAQAGVKLGIFDRSTERKKEGRHSGRRSKRNED